MMSGSFLMRLLTPARPAFAVQVALKSTGSAKETSGSAKPPTAPPVDEFAGETAASAERTGDDAELMATIPEAEEAREQEELFQRRVEQLRNVSRFDKERVVRLHKRQMPLVYDAEAGYLKSAAFYRRLYAKYGRESGIEPSLAWPTAQELERTLKFEAEKGLTLEQKIGIFVERKKSEMEAEQKVVKESEAALKKMPKQIDEFYQRITRKYKIEEDKKAKQREILDMARDYYGYDVDPRDQKVQDFIKKVQAERKQETKKSEAKTKAAAATTAAAAKKKADSTAPPAEAKKPDAE